MSLTAAELASRRAFDWRVASALQSSALGGIRGYASYVARQSRSALSDADGARGLAVMYEVDFAFRILTGPGTEAGHATALFDVSSSSYPFATPTVTFLTRPYPWSTHVHMGGGVCLGDFWRKDRLLAQLVVHVMKIANLDEPVREVGYDGFSGEAYDYWKRVLRAKPYVANLPYPALPVAITHGSAEIRPVFSAAEASVFADASDAPAFEPLLFDEVR